MKTAPGRACPATRAARARAAPVRRRPSSGARRPPRSAQGAALRLGRDFAATRRTCTDAAQATADAYGRALARVAAWRLEDGSLVLLDRRDAVLAISSPQPAALTDTVWRVTGYADGHPGWSGLRRSSLVTVEFDPEVGVRGSGEVVATAEAMPRGGPVARR